MQISARHRTHLAVALAVLTSQITTAVNHDRGDEAFRLLDWDRQGLQAPAVALLQKELAEARGEIKRLREAANPNASSSDGAAQGTDFDSFGKGQSGIPLEIEEAATPARRNFKMPEYHHVDSLSRVTGGFLDWFVVIYWGLFILGIVLYEKWERDHTGDEKEIEEDCEEDPHNALLSTHGESKELKPNVWALSLISSCGQAHDTHGNLLSPTLVFVAGIVMGVLQLLTLFLVVYDIDPSSSPYTEKPAVPWKTSPLTVNCMKVVMVFFLGMYVVSEAADAYDNYVLASAVNERLLVPKSWVLFIPTFHYLVTLSVILAGVSVVLSCQDTPTILFSSMAILFITGVDELFWGFFERTFDIQAKWHVHVNESAVPKGQLVKKCIIMFPMAWGFCLLLRAWYRDQMPAVLLFSHRA